MTSEFSFEFICIVHLFMNVIFTQRTKDLLFSMSVVNIIDAKHRALKRRKIVKYLTNLSAEIKGLKKKNLHNFFFISQTSSAFDDVSI